jgi:hypothetical protein
MRPKHVVHSFIPVSRKMIAVALTRVGSRELTGITMDYPPRLVARTAGRLPDVSVDSITALNPFQR